MKYLSLFSGIGGFELGIQQAYKEEIYNKYEEPVFFLEPNCVGYSEIDPDAIRIYERHFNHKNFGDITKIKDLPDFELLVGGFPCPTFSIAGKRAGFADSRGELIFDVIRILKAKKPKHFILENVRGLLNHSKGETFKVILDELGDCGYELQWFLLDSQDFGVAQQRKRVYIIGNLRGECPRKILCIGQGTSGDDSSKPEMGTRGLCLTTRTGARQDPTAETFIGYCLNTKARGVGQIWNETHVARIDPTGERKNARFSRRMDRIRGKVLGNAVTVNVVREIFKKLIS